MAWTIVKEHDITEGNMVGMIFLITGDGSDQALVTGLSDIWFADIQDIDDGNSGLLELNSSDGTEGTQGGTLYFEDAPSSGKKVRVKVVGR